MKLSIRIALAQLLLSFPLFYLPAQTVATQTFTSSTAISVINVGAGSVYPSNIGVSGMPAFLHGFNVKVPQFFHTVNFNQVDLLLEAPNGQRLMLLSDLNSFPGPVVMFDVGFGTESEIAAAPNTVTNGNNFLPANFGGVPDTFPALGPVNQPNPDPFAWQDINPNGIWKLYVIDDTPGGNTNLQNGWSITIRAGDGPACKRPGVPELVQTADFSAQIRWDAGPGNTQWDVLVGNSQTPAPDYNTAPTLQNLAVHENVTLDNLQPGAQYYVWVRADCGGQSVSRWRGPLVFTTTYNPCSNTTPVAMCQLVNDPVRPYYSNYLSTFNKCWIFPFVPPADGDYFIHYPGANSYAYPFYRLADTCDQAGWIQADSSVPGTNSSLVMSNLQGGAMYWMAHLGTGSAPLPFYWSACPTYKLSFNGVNAYTDSIRIVFNNPVPPDTIEFYTAPAPAPPPDEATPPAALLLPGQTAIALQGLQPATNYEYYYRTRCTSERVSCWQGPYAKATAAVCSTPQLLSIDTVTSKTVKITFTWTPNASLINWEVALCSANQKPWLNQYQAKESANPLIHGDTATLTFNNVVPYFPLVLYFHCYCGGGDTQPWYGPFPVPQSDALPYYVQPILCQEQVPASVVANGPAWLKPGAPCFSSDSSRQERVYRFPSGVTGPVTLYCVNWFGPTTAKKAAFYYKSASKPLDEFDWQHLGCWSVNGTVADTMPLTIPMEQDTAYYILLDYNINNGGFRFAAKNCNVVCPGIDTVYCQMAGQDSLILSWPSSGPGLRYHVRYQADGQSDAVEWLNYPDTFLVIPGAVAPWFYDVSVRTTCSGGFFSPWRSRRFLTGSHPVYVKSLFSYDCNPRFQRPFGSASGGYPYEVLPFKVPLNGDYYLKSRAGLFGLNGSAFAVYVDTFSPADPYEGLLAFVPNEPGEPFDPDRADTVLTLEAGHDYYLVTTRMAPNEEYFAVQEANTWFDGPAAVLPGVPVFRTNDRGAHGRVPNFTGELQPDFSCVDTAGWRHFYLYGNNPYDRAQDYLLLSMQDYPGLDYNASFGALTVYDLAGAARITNPPAVYLQNTSGWFVMYRFWNTEGYLQPPAPIKIRNYFTESDFTQLRDSVAANGGTLDAYTQLIFYKINGIHNPSVLDPYNSHPGVPAAQAFDTPLGYWEYQHGASAGPTTWRYGTHGTAHYAELLVRWLSGGGGGRSVNGQGALVPTVSASDPSDASGISVYPNPFADIIRVQTTGPRLEKVELWNLTGRQVGLVAGPASQMELPAVNLPAGMYILRVTTAGGDVYTYRVSKAR